MIFLKSRVKWWVEDRGFGFIARSGEPDVFVHVTSLADGLSKLLAGDEVEYRVIADKDWTLAGDAAPGRPDRMVRRKRHSAERVLRWPNARLVNFS
jgi:CspA family cold shock protein